MKTTYRRRGMILVVVMVVIALLALAAGTFSHLMVAERRATDLAGRQAQARALADSGIEMLKVFITQEKEIQDQFGGCYDNELKFRGRIVVGDQQTADVGRFTVVAPRLEYGLPSGIRYGLEDESTRLNINALIALDKKSPGTGRKILMGLPGMTEDIADSILDWLDEDEEIREFGAESAYYSGVVPPCTPANGPLKSIEELLLVRGIRENPSLLIGTDFDRNGTVGVGEPDSQSILDVDNSDGSMNGGWAAYLTLYAVESNLNSAGEKRIDLNQNNLEQLRDQLEEVLDSEWANFIVAYRLGEDTDDPRKGSPDTELDLSQQPKRTLTTVLDLIGKNVKVALQNNQQLVLENPFSDEPGMMDSYLPTLMDNVAVVSTSPLAGRINVNQASRTVLLGIPGMTEELVERIIAEREPDPTIAMPSHSHETWLLSEGLVTLEEMKALIPYVTAGGSIYRAQVIGFMDRGGPAVRIETVLDATSTPARVLLYRDISNLGRGYPLEILQSLDGGLGGGVGGGLGATY